MYMDAQGRAVRRCRAARWCLWWSGERKGQARVGQAGKAWERAGEGRRGVMAMHTERKQLLRRWRRQWIGGLGHVREYTPFAPQSTSLPAPQHLISRSAFTAQPPAVQGHGGTAVEAGWERGDRARRVREEPGWQDGGNAEGQGKSKLDDFAPFHTDKGRPQETGGPSALRDGEESRERGYASPVSSPASSPVRALGTSSRVK